MSNIDFQNGFVCGMATRGFTRSGEYYKPIIWNDSGVYSYFYIDFKKSMEFFTLGMFNESIIVHDSAQLVVREIEYVSPSVYKIVCDISDKVFGITILNKETSLLAFSGGEKLPVFSVHIFIEGQDRYERLKYTYETCDFIDLDSGIFEDNDIDISSGRIDISAIKEDETFILALSPEESINISLT